MRRAFWKAALAVGALILGMYLCLSGCVKKSTEPPPIQPDEHLFYISARLDENRSLVKAFSVEQRAFIDSFTVDSFQIGNVDVIGNDEKLLVTSRNEGVRVYGLASKEMLFSTSQYCCGGRTSRNSAYFDAYAGGMKIFETAAYTERFYDSGQASFSSFSFDSRYCLYTRSDSIVAYNILDDSIESCFGLTNSGAFFHVYDIWPTIDMKKLFIVGYHGLYLDFAVCDLDDDSVRILQTPLKTWGEDAVVSPDGKYLYFVNTPYADYEASRMRIDIYDVQTEQIVTSISTREYNYFEPQHIALSSDGQYLMATPWIVGGYDVLLIDAVNFEVIGSFQFGDQIVPEFVCTKH